MHKLIIEDDEGKSVVVPFVRDEITIGRQEGNTIRLTEQNISRRHARLYKQNGNLFVEDLSSFNGVRVNGARIQIKQSLKDGDEITIGDYRFGIRSEKPAGTGPPAEQPAPAQKLKGVPDRTIGYGEQQPFAPALEKSPEAVKASVAQHRTATTAPIPDEVMEGQPTIPVRTLAEDTRGGRSSDVPPARLQVTGGPLDGTEFLLDRASVVIGRTPENDIVLNHKSISRHHAKIISDGNDFIIVDLESANGVRVNGRKEERVQLEHGDLIELGHVRIRFVVGLGDDLPDVKRSKKPLLAAAGAGIIVLGALVFTMAGGNNKPRQTQPNVTPPKLSTASTPAPAPTPAPSESTADLLARAEQSAEQEKWDEALALLREAALLDPASARIAQLAARLENEQRGAAALAIVRTHAESGNLQAARLAARDVTANSKAAAKLDGLLETARERFVASTLATARANVDTGDCAAAVTGAEAVLAEVAGNAEARTIIAICRKAGRAPVMATRSETGPPRPARETRPAAEPASPQPAKPTATPTIPEGDPDEFIKQAQDAWLRGQYGLAIEAARTALKIRPGILRAHQIIAVCSCSLRDQDGALRAYAQLDPKNKSLVKSLCQKNGVELD